MTEDEAKAKWCPMFRVSSADGFVYNNREGNSKYCITSECMWWVWDIKWDSEGVIKEGEGHCGATK